MPEGPPTDEACLQLHAKHGSHTVVIAHCREVQRLALRFAELARANGLAVRKEVVGPAALLHDIGRSASTKPDHGWRGARILRNEGIPEPICLAVERHVGAGLDAEDAQELGLPPGDYTPRSVEEKLVCHADNLFHATQRCTLEEEIADLRRKGLEKAVAKMKRLHEEVAAIIGTDPEREP